MQVFSYLEFKFTQLPLRIKLELYLIPILLVFLYFSFNGFEKEVKIFSKNKSFNFNSVNINMMKTLKDIEEFSKINKINILNIANQDKDIELSVESGIAKGLKLLAFLENYNSYSKLENIELEKNRLDVKVVFKNVYMKNKIDITSKLKQFEINSSKVSFKLYAIIENRAYINKKWLKVGDMLDFKYKVELIEKKGVVLNDGSHEFRLELYPDEHL